MSPQTDERRQRFAAALRDHLKREPTPEELDAALELRRKSLAEFAAPSDERITAAVNANQPNDGSWQRKRVT